MQLFYPDNLGVKLWIWTFKNARVIEIYTISFSITPYHVLHFIHMVHIYDCKWNIHIIDVQTIRHQIKAMHEYRTTLHMCIDAIHVVMSHSYLSTLEDWTRTMEIQWKKWELIHQPLLPFHHFFSSSSSFPSVVHLHFFALVEADVGVGDEALGLGREVEVGVGPEAVAALLRQDELHLRRRAQLRDVVPVLLA